MATPALQVSAKGQHNNLSEVERRVIDLMTEDKWYSQSELKTSRQVLNRLRSKRVIKRKLLTEIKFGTTDGAAYKIR